MAQNNSEDGNFLALKNKSYKTFLRLFNNNVHFNCVLFLVCMVTWEPLDWSLKKYILSSYPRCPKGSVESARYYRLSSWKGVVPSLPVATLSIVIVPLGSILELSQMIQICMCLLMQQICFPWPGQSIICVLDTVSGH